MKMRKKTEKSPSYFFTFDNLLDTNNFEVDEEKTVNTCKQGVRAIKVL